MTVNAASAAVAAAPAAGSPSKYGATAAAAADGVDEWSPTGEATKKAAALWRWNVICGVAHLVQAVAMVALSQASATGRDFKLPLLSNYADWAGGFPRAATTQRALLPFAPVTSIFSFLSAAAHFTVLLFWSTYVGDLKKGLNKFRWYEYAASSSIMIAQIAQLYGMYDILTLVLLMCVNACMNLFGLLHEVINARRAPADVDWTAFWFGSFAGAAAWAAVFAIVFGNPGYRNIPGFVWAILFVYFAMFQTFPANMVFQYLQWGPFSDARNGGWKGAGYLYGERVYMILSLVAKSLLIWIVYGGINQPNACACVSARPESRIGEPSFTAPPFPTPLPPPFLTAHRAPFPHPATAAPPPSPLPPHPVTRTN